MEFSIADLLKTDLEKLSVSELVDFKFRISSTWVVSGKGLLTLDGEPADEQTKHLREAWQLIREEREADSSILFMQYFERVAQPHFYMGITNKPPAPESLKLAREILWEYWSKRDAFVTFRQFQIAYWAGLIAWGPHGAALDKKPEPLSEDLNNGPDLQRWILRDFQDWQGDIEPIYTRLYPIIRPIVRAVRVRSVWLKKREMNNFMSFVMWNALGRNLYNGLKLRRLCDDAWEARDGQIAYQILKLKILAHHSHPHKGCYLWEAENREFLDKLSEPEKPKGSKQLKRERFILGVAGI